MGRLLGRVFRILAWLAPVYQFRTSVWRKTGVKIGKRVYIGNLTMFDGQYPHLITIEDEVSIGSHVTILAHADGSLFHQRRGIFDREVKPVLIKQGAWITSNCVILPGVTIGKGAIVAAGSVVSRDVPDFIIVAGNPARPVSKLEFVKKRNKTE